MSHEGERLSHSTKGSFHCSRTDRSPSGSQLSQAVSVSENLQDGDGIIEDGKVGVTV